MFYSRNSFFLSNNRNNPVTCEQYHIIFYHVAEAFHGYKRKTLIGCLSVS
jgi:hypothetical protein